jgi:hypothetical protein
MPQLSPRRLFFGTSTALVLVAFLAASLWSRRANTMNASHRADLATMRIDSLLRSGPDSVRAISLGYLERTRLGLGSPFRLVDQAARDPRLNDSIRHEVAWGVVGLLMRRQAYEISPAVLDEVGPAGAGDDHLRLIKRIIGESDDPRTAELSLRLAYALAASQGTISFGGVATVNEVIAQLRDADLAERDLKRVIPAAAADGVDLIEEIQRSRAARTLSVEAPLPMAPDPAEREAAIDAVPAILHDIGQIRAQAGTRSFARSMVDPRSAIILARLSTRIPPLAAARIPAITRSAPFREDTSLDEAALVRLLSVTNEESLVAATALADRSSEGRSRTAARLAVSAGVALRAHNQDRVWFPGDRTASVGSVVGLYNLRSISFDSRVPQSWRPYYAMMISSALEDFRQVLPAYDPSNLAFDVTMDALPDSALAMHDPRTRTLRLSAWTPSGTLAHELAHDVDWQAGHRLFKRAGGYATDRAIQEHHVALATAVRGLTAARLTGRGRMSAAGSSRPAEVFARSVDWFIADALARRGITNGYLTGIEDPMLPGFAAFPGDAAAMSGASALVKSLTEMTALPDSVGAAYLARWNRLDEIDPSVTVLRILDAPVSSRGWGRAWLGFDHALQSSMATGSLCLVDRLASGTAQDRLSAMAVDARAKGIVFRRAHVLSPSSRPAWARAVLGDPMSNPSSASEMLMRMTAAVAEGAGRAGLIPLPPAPFKPAC